MSETETRRGSGGRGGGVRDLSNGSHRRVKSVKTEEEDRAKGAEEEEVRVFLLGHHAAAAATTER